MEIKTASWFADLPDGHVRIGVSRGTPRGMKAGYKLYRSLNPGSWFRDVTPTRYVELFNAEILAKLDPVDVAEKLYKLAGGRIAVMVCYESAPSIHRGEQFCHRHMVAAWLEAHTGLKVEEVGHPDLRRFEMFRLAGWLMPHYGVNSPASVT